MGPFVGPVRADRSTWVLVLTLGAGLPACSDDDIGSGPGSETGAQAVTYHQDIRPIIESNCLGCHREGGIGPFSLETWEDVREVAEDVVFAVHDDVMPPWKPDPSCYPMRDERLLTQAEMAAFEAWGEAEYPEGNPAHYVAPDNPISASLARIADREPELVIRSQAPYLADPNRPDDYRCLPLDYAFEQDTFVEAMDIVPEQRQLVHHVLLYLVPEADIPSMNQLSDREPGTGYTCFGGPRIGAFETLGGWVPGGQPMIWPPDSAVLIPAHSRVVMQVHYNVANLKPGEVPAPDWSEVHLYTRAASDPPSRVVNISLFANFGIYIPAGDEHSVHDQEFTLPFDAEIIGITPHMHTLGSSIRVDLERQDGSSQCLVDIPDWDFNWQQFYSFPDDAPLHAERGSSLHLQCSYDNSPANQPVVNGERLEPRNVAWGDGTYDEMCLAYLITSSPYSAGSSGNCAGFESCYDACDPADSQCVLGCTFVGGQDCALCMVQGLGDCGQAYCPAELAPLFSCFQSCDDYVGCLSGPCAEEYDTTYQCIRPHLEAGECNEGLSQCDVAF